MPPHVAPSIQRNGSTGNRIASPSPGSALASAAIRERSLITLFPVRTVSVSNDVAHELLIPTRRMHFRMTADKKTGICLGQCPKATDMSEARSKKGEAVAANGRRECLSIPCRPSLVNRARH
jgi:hypothetical protein